MKKSEKIEELKNWLENNVYKIVDVENIPKLSDNACRIFMIKLITFVGNNFDKDEVYTEMI